MDCIVPATFVSIWDDGYRIESSCKVNTITKEVFDIEIVTDDPNIESLVILVEERVRINGKEFPVYGCGDEIIPNVYFYRL